MKTQKELQMEIENLLREMAQCVIAQSDLDIRLTRLDKRRAFLEKELEAFNATKK